MRPIVANRQVIPAWHDYKIESTADLVVALELFDILCYDADSQFGSASPSSGCVRTDQTLIVQSMMPLWEVESIYQLS